MMNEQEFNESWTPEANTGCHIWIRGCTGQGYGALYQDNTQILAHRFAWSLRFGSIPDGCHVLHKCDTPSCVNTDHLFLGTQSDNMRDAVAKGRKGKLNPSQIKEIRSKTGSLRDLAKEYGVNFHTIHDIKTRRNWKQI